MTGLQLLSLWDFHHVQKNQVHNELAVEKIVRQRSLDGEDAVLSHMHCQWFFNTDFSISITLSVFLPSFNGCRGTEVVECCTYPRFAVMLVAISLYNHDQNDAY